MIGSGRDEDVIEPAPTQVEDPGRAIRRYAQRGSEAREMREPGGTRAARQLRQTPTTGRSRPHHRTMVHRQVGL